MKLLNKYTYLFIGILALVLIAIFAIIPRFQTQEFDPIRVVEISEGVTTTTKSPENNNQTNQTTYHSRSKRATIFCNFSNDLSSCPVSTKF